MKNQNSNEMLLLKESVNNLIVELCLTSTKCQILEDAFLDILKDMDPSIFKERYRSYIDCLEKAQAKSMNDIAEILLDAGDIGFHSRKSFELFQHFSHLKRSEDYKK